MTGRNTLSARLKAIADLVTMGNRVCDVGCDHGYLSIYLVEQKISPGAIAMDVREGPLGHAREHVLRAGVEDYIALRLSDGLTGFEAGEAQTLICAGMGGRLMQRILEREPSKTKSFRELILQPQSELASFRRFLREEGYSIVWEDMIYEDGKFYPVIRAVPEEMVLVEKKAEEKGMEAGNFEAEAVARMESREAGNLGDWRIKNIHRQELEDRYGPILLKRKHPVLLDYLKRERESADRLKSSLEESSGSEKAAERLKGLLEEIKYMEEAIRLCGTGHV